MGMQRDTAQRKTLARIDDANRRDRVKVAREHIHEKSNGINSKGVQNLLQENSLVPTTVYTPLLLGLWLLMHDIRMHFQISFRRLVSTFSACL
jgi:hypothetical protein